MNIKTKEILALEFTDEMVNGGKVVDKLLKHVLKATMMVRLLQSSLFWPMVHMIPMRCSNTLRKTKSNLESR